MANEVLYLRMKQNVEVITEQVFLKDIASLTCKDEHICAKAKALKVFTFQSNPGKEDRRQVISILKIIQMLQELCPNLTVESLGEMDTILEFVKVKDHGKAVQTVKTVIIAFICFFGTAFTVMAFHNDVGITKVFTQVYKLIMGVESSGYTILEVTYSIGLAIGILCFFNHIGRKRITKDPTPIEVEMRAYEKEVNIALVETADRAKKTIDVK